VPAGLALIFDFDGTLYVGDLPILAYARHCAEQLTDQSATDLIDGIRFFLEGKSAGNRRIDLSDAEDGYQAVEVLASALGLTDPQVRQAYRLARADLAASAFALEAPEGLVALLDQLRGADQRHGVHIAVVTNAAALGVGEVLAAIELAGLIDEVIIDAGKPAGMPDIIAATLRRIDAVDTPDRLMVVGDRWADDLADAHRARAVTAMVDRFSRGDGEPALRAADLVGLIPGIRQWAQERGAQERGPQEPSAPDVVATDLVATDLVATEAGHDPA
jgi:phosphoglycolate phosphatase-like HAD superfamily hydrolase